MDNTCRVLIFDDHALIRAGLRSLLTLEPGFEVVGEAENGRDAIRAAGALAPQLVLMDLTLPVVSGIDAAAAIKRRYPEVRVLMMTLHKEPEFVDASLNAGADGFILKTASHEELRAAMRSVLLGVTYLGKGVTTQLAEHTDACGMPGAR
jgi:DNA-binding NarL/FixJ family response regulator